MADEKLKDTSFDMCFNISILHVKVCMPCIIYHRVFHLVGGLEAAWGCSRRRRELAQVVLYIRSENRSTIGPAPSRAAYDMSTKYGWQRSQQPAVWFGIRLKSPQHVVEVPEVVVRRSSARAWARWWKNNPPVVVVIGFSARSPMNVHGRTRMSRVTITHNISK